MLFHNLMYVTRPACQEFVPASLSATLTISPEANSDSGVATEIAADTSDLCFSQNTKQTDISTQFIESLDSLVLSITLSLRALPSHPRLRHF